MASAENSIQNFAKVPLGDNVKVTVLPGTKQNYEMLKNRVTDASHRLKQQQLSESSAAGDAIAMLQSMLKNPVLVSQLMAAQPNLLAGLMNLNNDPSGGQNGPIQNQNGSAQFNGNNQNSNNFGRNQFGGNNNSNNRYNNNTDSNINNN